jgi:hypothetical protein
MAAALQTVNATPGALFVIATTYSAAGCCGYRAKPMNKRARAVSNSPDTFAEATCRIAQKPEERMGGD